MDSNANQQQEQTSDTLSQFDKFVEMMDNFLGVYPEGETKQERHLDAIKKHLEIVKNINDDGDSEAPPDLQCIIS